MRYIIIQFAIISFFLSCNKSKKEFYETGELKKEFAINQGEIEGKVAEYYKSGNLKELHYFKKGVQTDSSFFFYEQPINKIKKVVHWLNNDSTKITEYYSNDNVKARGGRYKGIRVGKWNLYNESGHLDATYEYKRIKAKEYLNQTWYFGQKGDTLSKGNSYYFNSFNDIKLDDVRFYFFLNQPFFSSKSRVSLIIPRNQNSNFNEDFSNEDEIELMEIPSLADDGLKHNNMRNNIPYNLIVNFDKSFKSKGKTNFRGIIVEALNDSDKSFKPTDTISWNERRIYFDKEVYVK